MAGFTEFATLVVRDQSTAQINKINAALRTLFRTASQLSRVRGGGGNQFAAMSSGLAAANRQANTFHATLSRLRAATRSRTGGAQLISPRSLQTLNAIEREAHQAKQAVSMIGAQVNVAGLQHALSLTQRITNEAKQAKAAMAGYGRGT